MECSEDDNQGVEPAVNSIILDYYKKFGRKRDLEQYFSLSTAQGDVRDPTGMFWRNIKSQSDSSDSGGKRSDSSQELCRISIKCSIPEPSSSQDENTKTKSESTSPPIITEDLAVNVSRHSDDESAKSGDENSQKSLDVMLDTSTNKPLSPTSSVTSQRKLEWDSLADVGYGNESDRKTSASSLSTLERLALQQQYTNNDTKESLGAPTGQSTPMEDAENKSKIRKGNGRKTTKFYKKDVDFVEVNLPHASTNAPSQAINVNLTKHISFSVEKNGDVTVDNVKKDVSVSPEKVSVETEVTPQIRFDKEIQTSLTKSKEKSTNGSPKSVQPPNQRIPIIISLNTLRNRHRKKKIRQARRKLKNRKREAVNKDTPPVQERSGEQLSEADSFEYMPGHIYNQNHLKTNQSKSGTTVGNKSSLESSGGLTTESSKGSKHSFTQDLEKSIDLLKSALQDRYDDKALKNKLVKEIVQRLLKTKYRDDDSTTDFLSGLSFSSKKIGLGDSNSTSTSDANNSNCMRPKKSILRMDKFNANAIASTSQSAPNLPAATNSDKPVRTNLVKHLTSSNTDTEISSREKVFDNSLGKASSQELYKKYLEALKREEAYKKHLKDKELFLKQKLTNSDSAFKVPERVNMHMNKRLKDLMKDLTRNNYDDGSGDASKLEGSDNADFEQYTALKGQRSHSVFTLSSSNSECSNKKQLKKRLQNDINELSYPGPSHTCCCQHQCGNIKIGVTDSSVQVNIKDKFELKEDQKKKDESQGCKTESPQNTARLVSDKITGDIKYVCLCTEKAIKTHEQQDNFLIYKCSRLTNRGVQEGDSLSRASKICGQSSNDLKDDSCQSTSKSCKNQIIKETDSVGNVQQNKSSKSSQTNLLIKMMCGLSEKSEIASDTGKEPKTRKPPIELYCNKQLIHEATRCIQTEISINPQIADPTLSDINIVNDFDCVKLINENFKEIKKPISKSDIRNRDWQSDAEAGTNSDTGRNRATSEDSIEELLEDVKDVPFIGENYSQDNLFATKNVCGTQEEVSPENYTIPIQGTNMKLMVTIGSSEPKRVFEEKFVQGSTKGVITDKHDLVEESTSLLEECSKSVQCRNYAEDAFMDRISKGYTTEVDLNSNRIVNNHNDPNYMKKGCVINTCMPQNESKFHTYPKNVTVFEKKPFLRSNTDTRVLDRGSIRKENIINKDINTLQEVAFGHSNQVHSSKQIVEINDNLNACQNTCCGTMTGITDQTRIGVQSDFPNEIQVTCLNEPQNTYPETNKLSKPKLDSSQPKAEIKSKNQTDLKSQSCCRTTETESLESEKSKSATDDEIGRFKSKSEERNPCLDPVLNMIKDITKRYSKDDVEKGKRKKCFKEIVTVLNYLLDTDESTDREQPKSTRSCTESVPKPTKPPSKVSACCQTKSSSDKAVQSKKNKGCASTESSEFPTSTDIPGTSSDSATCKVLSKIKKECEKYHQKRCKSHNGGKKCDPPSTTSLSCDQCRRVHHCSCRYHKCKHKSKCNTEKGQKKSVAYNLILQTSESMISEETTCGYQCRPLQNIIVKVPSKKRVDKMPFKEVESKIEKKMYHCSPRYDKGQRSRSLPNECDVSSTEECKRTDPICTVRDYLEINRPDIVEKCSQRQNNLKIISESRANERAAQRNLLSMHMDKQLPLSSFNIEELRYIAREIGVDTPRKNRAPKFISEREMKKHSEKIYKSLPEVLCKKEEIKKEKMKKTNLLMANIFKKNLQKKTLRGAVNLSNYSTVIKI